MQGKGVEDSCSSEDYLDAKKPNLACGDKMDLNAVESDIELDDADVMEPDNDPPQKVKMKQIGSDESCIIYCVFSIE